MSRRSPRPYKLDVKLIEEMLNEIFNTNTKQNERILDVFILQRDIEFGREDVSLSDDGMEEEEEE